MSALLVRFHDASLERFSWIVEGAQADKETPSWQQASAQELGSLGRNQASVKFIIPQQYVYMTRFEVPANASRQILSSIEYQIEDQLAQDVDLQHVAIGDQSSNPVAIAVIEKAIMEGCRSLQQAHSLSVSSIVPELFLCPRPGQAGEVCLIDTSDGLLLRYGDYRGIKCRTEMLDAVLKQIEQEQEIVNIACYLSNPDIYQSLALDRYTSQCGTLSLDRLKIDKSKAINLQQGPFQVSSLWTSLIKVWRWIIALMAILLVVAGYNKALALQALEAELADVKATQYQLIKRYLPADVDETANLKKALISVLKQNQSGQQKIDFLGLLNTFSQSKAGYPLISVDKIGYQKGRLSIDVKTGQLSELEALLAVIESTGQAVKIENLDIKPEATSGRFVLTGEAG